MENLLFKNKIRKILREFFQNQVVYSNDPNQFKYFDGEDKTTPSDLDSEFDIEFDNAVENQAETEEKTEKK